MRGYGILARDYEHITCCVCQTRDAEQHQRQSILPLDARKAGAHGPEPAALGVLYRKQNARLDSRSDLRVLYFVDVTCETLDVRPCDALLFVLFGFLLLLGGNASRETFEQALDVQRYVSMKLNMQ